MTSLGHRPVTVRADLAAGLAHAAPWGTALDGLLAAELWGRQLAAEVDMSSAGVRKRYAVATTGKPPWTIG